MSLREEFVMLAHHEDANISRLCRQFNISRKTGYKWIDRQLQEKSLSDHSRRPLCTPRRSAEKIEQAVVQVRRQHPAWGGRKIRRVLINEGHEPGALPAPSTIGQILLRRGLIDLSKSAHHRPFTRFEHAHPNDLWQMDFKGHVPLLSGGRCHPLTVLDDHSRFNLSLRACGDETRATVELILIDLFQLFGQPLRILCDNGPPWGSGGGEPYTALGVWLMRHGIAVTHGRPYHPQTQGKEERFHRTLGDELLKGREAARDLIEAQQRFDPWRDEYNQVRPHEAIAMATPATLYRPSPRSYDPALPPPQYDQHVVVRKVDAIGKISYRGRDWRIGKAFAGQSIGLAPAEVDGILRVLFAEHEIGRLDLRSQENKAMSKPPCGAGPWVATLPKAPHREEQSVTHVSEHVSPMSPV